MADLNRADELQPNDLPTLQLRARVSLSLGDTSAFFDDLHGRADTELWLGLRGYVYSSIGDDEQALDNLVAAEQMGPGTADRVCDALEDMLAAKGAPQSHMAKLTALRHSIHTRIQVSLCRPSLHQVHFPLSLHRAAM